MTDREAFLKKIIDYPEDDTPRLVYADWLDEHGEPERAEFIRAQIKLAEIAKELRVDVDSPDLICQQPDCLCSSVGDLRKRERNLLKVGHAAWMPVVTDFYFIPRLSGEPLRENHVLYRRGFPVSVQLSWKKWLGCADAILSEAPVADVELTTIPITVADFTGNETRFRLQGRNRAFIEITLPRDLYLHGIPWLLSREWPAVKKFTFPMPELPTPMTEFLPLTTAAD